MPRFSPPASLRPGDPIVVIAPSGPFEPGDFEAGVTKLRERYEVRYGEDVTERKGFVAGDDARRLRELRGALAEPDVKALVAVRGGYGATRLLPDLPTELVRDAGKLLVGFSDITALHALWARAGCRSVHGSMVAAIGRGDEGPLGRWFAALEGEVPDPVTGLEPLAPGSATGPLVGGNLSVLCAMVGTPFAPPIDGALLFLEDVAERPYRIDRMLTSLRQAGCFDHAAGVVLGAFAQCHPASDGVTVDAVLSERLGDLTIPVIKGLPAGHTHDNMPLPFGARATLDANTGTLRFLEAATG